MEARGRREVKERRRRTESKMVGTIWKGKRKKTKRKKKRRKKEDSNEEMDIEPITTWK